MEQCRRQQWGLPRGWREAGCKQCLMRKGQVECELDILEKELWFWVMPSRHWINASPLLYERSTWFRPPSRGRPTRRTPLYVLQKPSAPRGGS